MLLQRLALPDAGLLRRMSILPGHMSLLHERAARNGLLHKWQLQVHPRVRIFDMLEIETIPFLVALPASVAAGVSAGWGSP